MKTHAKSAKDTTREETSSTGSWRGELREPQDDSVNILDAWRRGAPPSTCCCCEPSSRRRFLSKLLFAAAALYAPWRLAARAEEVARGGQVEWARLKTRHIYWDRHAESDPDLLRYIRMWTTLNIGTKWHAANVAKIQELARYPFLFSEGLHHIRRGTELQNLGEYFLRGGFVLVDACSNIDINPDPDLFLREQMKTIQSVLPGARTSAISEDHEIFRSCFEMKKGLPRVFYNGKFNPRWARHGLYAVHNNERLIAILSVAALQCGWAKRPAPPGTDIECMRMAVNIYVYVMSHV
jgi:hypothetical protein